MMMCHDPSAKLMGDHGDGDHHGEVLYECFGIK